MTFRYLTPPHAAFIRDAASVGKGTSYIMDNAAAKLKKKRMTKFEVRIEFPRTVSTAVRTESALF